MITRSLAFVFLGLGVLGSNTVFGQAPLANGVSTPGVRTNRTRLFSQPFQPPNPVLPPYLQRPPAPPFPTTVTQPPGLTVPSGPPAPLAIQPPIQQPVAYPPPYTQTQPQPRAASAVSAAPKL